MNKGDLASQPTRSRLEHAVDAKGCYRLARALVQLSLQERGRDGVPSTIILDFDPTDDPAHGQQEGVAFHGFSGQSMDHPLLVFDGDTGQLITAILRPGTVHASHGAKAILKRLVKLLRAQWPEVQIEFRADSGFAIPALYEYLAEQQIAYAIGLPTNWRLQALAAPLVAEAHQQHTETHEKVRLLGEEQYQAASWEHQRRVVIKAEVLAKGPNVRLVVTTRGEEPEALYDWYIQRGDRPELCIKERKNGCRADRLSDHPFWANQVRLLLHAAYGLLDTLRRWLMHLRVPRMELDTLRLQLLKIGGWVRDCLEGIRLHLASSHPGEPLWHLLASQPHEPPQPPSRHPIGSGPWAAREREEPALEGCNDGSWRVPWAGREAASSSCPLPRPPQPVGPPRRAAFPLQSKSSMNDPG